MVLSEVSVRMTRSDRRLPWGFGIREGHGGSSVVSEIQATGLADRAYMKCGDRLLRVNGRSVTSQRAAEDAVASAGNVLEMVVERNVSPFGKIYADHAGVDFQYPFNAIDYSSKYGSDRNLSSSNRQMITTSRNTTNYGSGYDSGANQSAANFISAGLVHHPPQHSNTETDIRTMVDKSGITFPSVRGSMGKFQESNRWNFIEPGTVFPTRFGRGNIENSVSSSFRSTRERSEPTFPSPLNYNWSSANTRLSHSPQPTNYSASNLGYGSSATNRYSSTNHAYQSHHHSAGLKQFPRLGEIDSQYRTSRPKSPIFVMGPPQTPQRQSRDHYYSPPPHQPAPPTVRPAPARIHSASPGDSARMHSPSPFKASPGGGVSGGAHNQQFERQIQPTLYNSPRALYSHNTAVDEYLKQTGGMFGSDAKTIEDERQMQEAQASATLRLIQERESRAANYEPPGERPWEGSLRRLATGTY